MTTTINPNQHRTLNSNNIYNNNTANVWIWNSTTNPESKLEVRTTTTDWNNLLLKNYTTTNWNFSAIRFWVNNSLSSNKAGIFFQRLWNFWIGALHFAINNENNNNNASLSNKIMTIKYAWNTWAVWVLTDNIEPWVALEINDTMRLKPRTTQPFVCDAAREWSIFFYDSTKESYPCYCWRDGNIVYKRHHTNWQHDGRCWNQPD